MDSINSLCYFIDQKSLPESLTMRPLLQLVCDHSYDELRDFTLFKQFSYFSRQSPKRYKGFVIRELLKAINKDSSQLTKAKASECLNKTLKLLDDIVLATLNQNDLNIIMRNLVLIHLDGLKIPDIDQRLRSMLRQPVDHIRYSTSDGLSAIAKATEYNLVTLNEEDKANFINQLNSLMTNKHTQIVDLAQAIWAIGVIFHSKADIKKYVMPNRALFEAIIQKILSAPPIIDADISAFLMGVSLLQLLDTISPDIVDEMIDNLRPQSILDREKVSALTKGDEFQLEAYICGFFVDVYVEKTKIIYEIDGRCHEKKLDFDKFRDNILKAQGYTVIRITYSDFLKIPVARALERTVANAKNIVFFSPEKEPTNTTFFSYADVTREISP